MRRPLTAIHVSRRSCGRPGCYTLELHLNADPPPAWVRALGQFHWLQLSHDIARIDGRILSVCVGEAGEAVARVYLEALIDAANAEVARLEGGRG